MLEAIARPKRNITKVERLDNCLLLCSEYGKMALTPLTQSIVRVRLVLQEDDLQEKSCLGINCNQSYADWDFEENDAYIYLNTTLLKIEVSRKTGTIRYFTPGEAGRLILAENENEGKLLESFESFRTYEEAEGVKVEIIKTPDGEKKVLKDVGKIFDKKLYRTRLSLDWQKDEALFGLGQAEEGIMDLRGTTQYLHQANMKISIPYLLSTHGYGLLLGTDSPVIFNDTAYGSYLYTEATEQMDYYFVYGEDFDTLIKGYRLLTGKAVMLPKWAFGYMQSQERYETAQELIDTVKEYRRRGVGLDCIILDWMSWTGHLWGQKTMDPERFPDPTKMMEELHELDARLLISIWPTMHEDGGNYKEFSEQKLLLPLTNICNAFDEKARKLYWGQANSGLFAYGIDGWWCDNSEPITPEWTRSIKPEPSESYHEYVKHSADVMPIEKCNAYGLMHAKGMYEGQRSVCNIKRVVNLTRNGYTGSQRYGAILWSGDTCASWESFRKQIVAGLQFCASGLPYWTLDIGAFFIKQGTPWYWSGEYETGTEDSAFRELYVRWFQYGAFLPIFRAHGTDIRREVWAFGEQGEPHYDALVKAIDLRYKLIPYIYSLAGDCWLNDGTIMRMLAFDFACDSKAILIKDQFMFGKSMMICPVTKPDATTRPVYLPGGGRWFDFYTNEVYEGGQTINASASLDTIPVFVREGSIIPTAKTNEEIELVIYPGKDVAFTIYEDAGDGYAYEDGEYSLTKISWNESSGNVGIEKEVCEIKTDTIMTVRIIRN